MNNKLIGLAAGTLLLLLGLGCQERTGADAGADSHARESAAEHARHGHTHEAANEHDGHDHADGEHAEHDEHGHDDHAHEEGGGGHAGHDHAALISLSPAQMKEFGVKTSQAQSGHLDIHLIIPGEVAINADTVGHVLPKLGGVVQQVTKNIGDTVRKGDLLAVVESRELAEAKADYLSARERESIAQATQERERQLFELGVAPEQDYINAGNSLREVQIQVRAAEQSLHALGLSEAQLERLVAAPHESLTRYEIYAPISGRILEKHVTLGEVVSASSELFLIADLSTVWVNLNVSQKDLPRIREGQAVRIRFSPASMPDSGGLPAADSGIADAQGTVKYIGALVAEDTRTAQARIVLKNEGSQWRPGMFVTGMISVDDAPVRVLVPLAALIRFEGQQTVFVQDEHGFEPRTVTIGRQSATHAEILSGLEPGETYVVEGVFTVKAELGKSEAGHGH